MTKTKATYKAIADKFNKLLGDNGNVSIIDTSTYGRCYGKYSLCLDDDAYDMINHDKELNKMYFEDRHTVGDYDYYIEPITSYMFDIEEL